MFSSYKTQNFRLRDELRKNDTNFRIWLSRLKFRNMSTFRWYIFIIIIFFFSTSFQVPLFLLVLFPFWGMEATSIKQNRKYFQLSVKSESWSNYRTRVWTKWVIIKLLMIPHLRILMSGYRSLYHFTISWLNLTISCLNVSVRPSVTPRLIVRYETTAALIQVGWTTASLN